MNNAQRKVLNDHFHNLLMGMGALKSEKRSKVKLPDGTEHYTYGYDLLTKYGWLTTYLDVEDNSYNILAKYLDPDLLPNNIPNKVYNPIPINGITFNGFAGKWNLHLGKVSKGQDLEGFTRYAESMFKNLIPYKNTVLQ